MATKIMATKIECTVTIKDKETGKTADKKYNLGLEHAKNLFKNPKRDKTWKVTDKVYTFKDGDIIKRTGTTSN